MQLLKDSMISLYINSTRELDRLTRPPESSAPPPPEGYKEGARAGLEDLIRKSQ